MTCAQTKVIRSMRSKKKEKIVGFAIGAQRRRDRKSQPIISFCSTNTQRDARRQDVVVGRRRRRGCERAWCKRSCGWLGFGFVGWLGPPKTMDALLSAFCSAGKLVVQPAHKLGARGGISVRGWCAALPFADGGRDGKRGADITQATASSMCCATGEATPLRHFNSLRGCWVDYLSIPAPTPNNPFEPVSGRVIIALQSSPSMISISRWL